MATPAFLFLIESTNSLSTLYRSYRIVGRRGCWGPAWLVVKLATLRSEADTKRT